MLKLCVTFLLITCAQVALAQSNAQQRFRVQVPTAAAILAPSGQVQLVHDETNDDQIFTPQVWTVKANSPQGVSVTFSTTTPFNHANQPFQRDVGLALALGTVTGPASWNVEAADSQSSYAQGVNSASVVASSNGIGRAELALTVRFVTDSFGTFATGDYNTTVVGTVAAK
ncbi:MAG: hypothetical protein Aurels2KO_17070 [Aureliella sp.]